MANKNLINYKYSKQKAYIIKNNYIPNSNNKEDHIYEEINDEVNDGTATYDDNYDESSRYYNNYYFKIEKDVLKINNNNNSTNSSSISPTSSIKSTNSYSTASTSSSASLDISTSLNMNNEEEMSQNRKSIKRVRFSKIENNNNNNSNVNVNVNIDEKSSSLIQFLTKIRNNNRIVINNNNNQGIELKDMKSNNNNRYNSILKKSCKNNNKFLVNHEELVDMLNKEGEDRSNLFYSFVPISTPTSSTASLKSDRSSTNISSTECISVGESKISPSTDLLPPNTEFNNIVEEFITRLMCKTKGNHNCLHCYKHKNKSLDDRFQYKPESNTADICKKCSINATNRQNFTLPTPMILKRSIDDRLSFRVTNLTIDDLKTKYHSKNTL